MVIALCKLARYRAPFVLTACVPAEPLPPRTAGTNYTGKPMYTHVEDSGRVIWGSIGDGGELP